MDPLFSQANGRVLQGISRNDWNALELYRQPTTAKVNDAFSRLSDDSPGTFQRASRVYFQWFRVLCETIVLSVNESLRPNAFCLFICRIYREGEKFNILFKFVPFR